MEAQNYQNSVPSFNTTMEAQSYQNSVPGDIQEDCVDGPLLPLLSNISFDGLAGWQLASLDVSADHLEINSVSSLSLPQDMVSPGHSLSAYKSSNDLPSVASLLKSQPNTNADEKVLNMTSSRSSIQHFEASKIVDCPSKESSQKNTTDLQNIVFDETEMLQKISSTDVIVDTEDIKKQVPIKSQRSLERQSSPPEKGEVLTVCLKLVKAENELLEKSRMCSSCSLKPRDVTFLPCGHFATCRSCAEPIFTCPICNNNILATLNTYLS
uniref:RING-type domain-containing protein n=1 Tax=Arion vulgaris TaxID=1028688 RepID=A0A0B7A7I9_9EUPU